MLYLLRSAWKKTSLMLCFQCQDVASSFGCMVGLALRSIGGFLLPPFIRSGSSFTASLRLASAQVCPRSSIRLLATGAPASSSGTRRYNMEIRRSDDRGYFDNDWLKTYHSFSFADYYRPDRMGFSTLRVINDDRVDAGMGFPTHPHRDMEIITYVLAGELAHKDSMGTGSVIRPGDVQRMSAGRGVRHSEYNHAKDQETHLLQIWIQPSERGIEPGYEQKKFLDEEKRGKLRLVASPNGSDRSVTIHTNACLYAGLFDGPNESYTLDLPPGRSAYVHVVKGKMDINGETLQGGDAAVFDKNKVGREAISIKLGNGVGGEVLVFDLP